ncbi:MAG: copper oxidase [Chloroflexi bacterium]|nr:MAG: copper oxidase [Chloroflexota bacterium]
MQQEQRSRRFNRRGFLKLGGQTALLGLLAGGGLAAAQRQTHPALAAPPAGAANAPLAQLPRMDIRLVATDGFMSLPGRRHTGPDAQPVYAFGFRAVAPEDANASPAELTAKYKGFVQWPSPILAIPKDIDLYITMTNLGFVVRPDLDDAHTIHWHGFRNPNAIFDGVPETSISVPPVRDFTYFYRPRVEGTYMYHCHFEDTEHVQLGMDGIVFIEANNGRTYDNDGGVTAFDRQFTLLLNEVDLTPHDNLEAVQEFIWSNYKPQYWVINGRAYPDTILRDQELPGSDFDLGDPELGYTQFVSSLIQANAGDRVLLRWTNLGYEQQAMQLLGPTMTVVGHDATFLGPNRYETNSIYIGPGEARDAIFTAPAYSAGLPGGSDPAGNYNVYWLRNRNAQRLVNGDLPGLGGQVTQVRVYPAGTLPPQAGPNQTF